PAAYAPTNAKSIILVNECSGEQRGEDHIGRAGTSEGIGRSSKGRNPWRRAQNGAGCHVDERAEGGGHPKGGQEAGRKWQLHNPQGRGFYWAQSIERRPR